MRRITARKNRTWCDWCLNDFPAAGADVDHVRPLSMGGTDTDGNVQVLCRGCHRLKTSTEFGARGLALCPPRSRCTTGGGDQGDKPSGDVLDGQVHATGPEFKDRAALGLGGHGCLSRSHRVAEPVGEPGMRPVQHTVQCSRLSLNADQACRCVRANRKAARHTSFPRA
ncbi:HNH endonuclease [Streptomyces sp. R-07]|uniref:HNH endonuclease n=1 Tax=Streptomyces sp. R-07 TaxID=3404052 RepID=UPI003CFAA662